MAIPLISSDLAGPLGAIHLPRLWSKVLLSAKGQLEDGYDECGMGFDQMVLDGLGIDRDSAVSYIKGNLPTYPQFESWVLAQRGGSRRRRIDLGRGQSQQPRRLDRTAHFGSWWLVPGPALRACREIPVTGHYRTPIAAGGAAIAQQLGGGSTGSPPWPGSERCPSRFPGSRGPFYWFWMEPTLASCLLPSTALEIAPVLPRAGTIPVPIFPLRSSEPSSTEFAFVERPGSTGREKISSPLARLP